MGYQDELAEMGIKSYDKDAMMGNLMRFTNSLIKNRGKLATRKANSTGMDEIGSVYAVDEPIYDAALNQAGDIEQNAYESQFNEQNFIKDQELKDAQIDDMEGSFFDDVLAVGGLATTALDVTGLGKNLAGLFSKKRKKATSTGGY